MQLYGRERRERRERQIAAQAAGRAYGRAHHICKAKRDLSEEDLKASRTAAAYLHHVLIIVLNQYGARQHRTEALYGDDLLASRFLRRWSFEQGLCMLGEIVGSDLLLPRLTVGLLF